MPAEACPRCGGPKELPNPCPIRANGCWMWDDSYDTHEFHACGNCDGTCHSGFHGGRFYTDGDCYPEAPHA